MLFFIFALFFLSNNVVVFFWGGWGVTLPHCWQENNWYSHFGKRLGHTKESWECHSPVTWGLYFQKWILSREHVCKDVHGCNICNAAQVEVLRCPQMQNEHTAVHTLNGICIAVKQSKWELYVSPWISFKNLTATMRMYLMSQSYIFKHGKNGKLCMYTLP